MSAKSSSGKPSSLVTMVTILRDYFFLGEQEYDGDEDSDESHRSKRYIEISRIDDEKVVESDGYHKNLGDVVLLVHHPLDVPLVVEQFGNNNRVKLADLVQINFKNFHFCYSVALSV